MSDTFSIILTVYDQGPELEAKLPAFLTQEYEPGYEVIVVDESSTDETPDVLKLFKNDYQHLYTTFLPKPKAQTSPHKLAFNIGIKASKYEYIIMAKISSPPTDTDILKAIAEVLDKKAQLTLGYVTKKHTRLQPFDSVDDARKHILQSERKLKKIHEWKSGNYTWGRYDFIIIRKDCTLELLKLFEQKLSVSRLFGIRLSILWKNFCRRSSTTVLVSE